MPVEEQQAQAVLDRIAATNGQAPATAPLAPTTRQRARLRDLLGPELRQRTLLILAAWLPVSTAYYGVFIWLPGRLVTQGYGFVRGYGFLVLLAWHSCRATRWPPSASRPSAAAARSSRSSAPAQPAACCSRWPSSRPGSPPPCSP